MLRTLITIPYSRSDAYLPLDAGPPLTTRPVGRGDSANAKTFTPAAAPPGWDRP
jgi:hypothetical protein